jgi:hypothetical protein
MRPRPRRGIVRHLRATNRARRTEGWACYHSEMDSFEQGGREYGIVGCAVGAPYAVLLAEQMFASGCRLLISITSSGQIRARRGRERDDPSETPASLANLRRSFPRTPERIAIGTKIRR